VEPRPRVFVTRRLPGGALGRLAEVAEVEVWPGPGAPPGQVLRERTREADGLLCLLTDPVDGALLTASPALRVVSSCSVGVDHVDLAAATARGIPVGHTPGVLTETTADLAFALLLAAARRVAEADRFVRAGGWRPEQSWEPDLLLGRDVHGATLGLVGLGPIGRAVARRAAGFGMRVLGWSRTRRELPGVVWAELPELLASADFVSLHLALVPETRRLIGRTELAAMRPGAILVNTARGGLVDESALVEALRSGPLAAAALDVFELEPLPATSPLLRLENVVFTPHVGSASLATRARMAELAVENLLAGLAGRRLPHCANPEVYGGA
jgi:glyoxylate reductase